MAENKNFNMTKGNSKKSWIEEFCGFYYSSPKITGNCNSSYSILHEISQFLTLRISKEELGLNCF